MDDEAATRDALRQMELRRALIEGFAGGGGSDLALVLLGRLVPTDAELDYLQEHLLDVHDQSTNRSAWGEMPEGSRPFWQEADLRSAKGRSARLDVVARCREIAQRLRDINPPRTFG